MVDRNRKTIEIAARMELGDTKQGVIWSHRTINAAIKLDGRWCKWMRHTFMEESDRWTQRIADVFGQSLRDSAMMVEIICMSVINAIRINGWEVRHLNQCDNCEPSQVWSKESVREQSRVEARETSMDQIISSGSTQGSPIVSIPIIKERPKIQ